MKNWLKNNRKTIINAAFFITLLGFTFYYLLKDNELQMLGRAITGVNSLWIVAGLGAMVVFFAFEALSLRLLMKTFGYAVGFGKCMKFALIDFYFSAITPAASGGQPAQICYMKKDGIEVGSSSLALLTFNLAYHIGILLISGSALLIKGRALFDALPALKYLAAFGFLAQFLLAATFIIAILQGAWLRKVIESLIAFLAKRRIIKRPDPLLKKVGAQMDEYRRGADLIRKKPFLFCKVLFLTLCHLLIFYTIPFWVYKAFGLSGVSLLGMVAFQSVFALCIECLPLPGGVGVAEKGFLLLYGGVFGSAIILPAMLLCRGLNYYGFLLVGAMVTAFAHIMPGRKVRSVCFAPRCTDPHFGQSPPSF